MAVDLSPGECSFVLQKDLFPNMLFILSGDWADVKVPAEFAGVTMDNCNCIWKANTPPVTISTVLDVGNNPNSGIRDGKFYSNSFNDKDRIDSLNSKTISFNIISQKQHKEIDPISQTQDTYYNPMPEDQPLPAQMPRSKSL